MIILSQLTWVVSESIAISNLFFVSFTGIASAAVVFGCFMCLVSFSSVVLVPIVFGNLSQNAQKICKSMLILIAMLMPLWTYINTQLAVSRAGMYLIPFFFTCIGLLSSKKVKL